MQLDNLSAAIVTGGSSGLGEATTRAFASNGTKVAIFDLNEAKGEALASELGCLFFKVDVTSAADLDAALTKARTAHGQERLLVNCAGTGNAFKTASRDKKTGEIRHFPLNEFSRLVNINLVGTFNCIAKSAAGMLTLEPTEDGERGVIINTGSVAAQDGQIGQAAYAASKAGIAGMTLPIARDLADHGIRVNTILPGIFRTPLVMTATEQTLSTMAASIPFPKRLGRPSEFASLVLEICRNCYFNGEVVRLDGAIRMPPR